MKDAVDSGIKSVTQIPYFEGDFWPNVLEDCAKALDGDVEQDKHSQDSSVDGDTEDSSCSSVACTEPLGKVHCTLLVHFCSCNFNYFFLYVLCLAIDVTALTTEDSDRHNSANCSTPAVPKKV